MAPTLAGRWFVDDAGGWKGGVDRLLAAAFERLQTMFGVEFEARYAADRRE